MDKSSSRDGLILYKSLKGVGAMARIGIRLTDQEKEVLAETARQDD